MESQSHFPLTMREAGQSGRSQRKAVFVSISKSPKRYERLFCRRVTARFKRSCVVLIAITLSIVLVMYSSLPEIVSPPSRSNLTEVVKVPETGAGDGDIPPKVAVPKDEKVKSGDQKVKPGDQKVKQGDQKVKPVDQKVKQGGQKVKPGDYSAAKTPEKGVQGGGNDGGVPKVVKTPDELEKRPKVLKPIDVDAEADNVEKVLSAVHVPPESKSILPVHTRERRMRLIGRLNKKYLDGGSITMAIQVETSGGLTQKRLEVGSRCRIINDLKKADIFVKETRGVKPVRNHKNQVIAGFNMEPRGYNVPKCRAWYKKEKTLDEWDIAMDYSRYADIQISYFRIYYMSYLSKLKVPDPTKRLGIVWRSSACFCSSWGRDKYVEDLSKLIEIHRPGKCLSSKMNNGKKVPAELDQYNFALAFENSRLEGYITEKLFHPMFRYNLVPVYIGAPDISDYIPEDAFVNANGLKPEELAAKLKRIQKNSSLYTEFFEWRKRPMPARFQKLLDDSKSTELDRLCRFVCNYSDSESG
eukprot:533665_1